MTIRPGEEWGTPVERPDDLGVAASDREVVSMVTEDPQRPVTVRGGDLFRSIGSPPKRSEMVSVDVDLIDIELDGDPYVAVSHVLLYDSLWLHRIIVVANVSNVGNWNVAPRAHPNDGKLDVLDVPKSFGLRQRFQARRRVMHGTHVPHPDLSYERVTEASWTFDKPMPCRIDGAFPINASQVTVKVRPDAFRLIF